MFVYVDYEDFKNKYFEVQKKYDEILREKEYLFSKTQPKAARADKGIAATSPTNVFDEYLIAKEKTKIDQRLEEIKAIASDRARLLKLKEIELRHSKNIWDRIYTMRYLDNLHIQKIAFILNYSQSQVGLIIGIAEIIKQAGLDPKYIPLVDLALGLLSGIGIYGIAMNYGIVKGIVMGLSFGLEACGVFSGLKNFIK
ncbi:hypothetical protein M9Y10_004576 [Tritrichomonas musculus]|uniref:Uncharacterized protein n=1 Tax=Tritrichomonas musculus TaxID=1915356 RepID=A0ABR2GQ15_9EUKA